MANFKRIFIPFDTREETEEVENDFHYQKWIPTDTEETFDADKEIEKHLNEGWRIVSSCPISGTFSLKINESGTKSFVVTDGIEVLLVKD